MQLEHALFIGVAFDDCVLTGGVTHPVPTAVFAIFQVFFCNLLDQRRAAQQSLQPVSRRVPRPKCQQDAPQRTAALATRDVLQRLAYG